MIGYDKYGRRGQHHVRAAFGVDRARHFGGGPDPPDQVQQPVKKSDAEVQEEARQERLARQRSRGRRGTVLTGGTDSAPQSGAGSAGNPGTGKTIG